LWLFACSNKPILWAASSEFSVMIVVGTIKVENGNIEFELHGVDEFLSIKRSITVPLSHVVSVSTEHVPWQPFKMMRIAGTSLSGVVKDGRFLSTEGVMFFEMHDPDKCITVNLDHETYKKIVFEA
jgi:hypothetical protein